MIRPRRRFAGDEPDSREGQTPNLVRLIVNSNFEGSKLSPAEYSVWILRCPLGTTEFDGRADGTSTLYNSPQS